MSTSGLLQLSGAGNCRFRLFDAKGNQIRFIRFTDRESLELQDLPAGAYAYSLENDSRMIFGKLIVQP